MLVQLQLHANRESVRQHPFGQLAWIQRAEHRTEEDGTAVRQSVLCHDLFCPFIVTLVLDHKFCFVLRHKPLDIGPMHPVSHAAPRALDVQDDMHRGIHHRGVNCSTGFKEHGESCLAQSMEQGVTVRLGERFASGDFNQLAIIGAYPVENVLDRSVCSAKEGIVRIAPGASQGAAGQADKDAGPTREGRFTLNTVKDFSDAHTFGDLLIR